MITKDQLNTVFEKIAQSLDISNELFEKAKDKYEDLGKWIDNETPEHQINIYPQGSFALGTVIKPLTDLDEYDLDLVCEFVNGNKFDAKELKVDVVKPLLQKYGDCEEPKEKKRCWQVTYKDSPQFHMDIIPAATNDRYISITDKDEENNIYDYIGSNPAGYIAWFKDRMKVRVKILKEQFVLKEFAAKIDDVPDYKIKTPLQRAIQILKRHRDIMFKDDTCNKKPISVIITTVAANIYNNEDSIYGTLKIILENTEKYINDSKKDGKYSILNPSYTGEERENFADKWNEHPERSEAFFEWISKAKEDIIENPMGFTSYAEIGNVLKFSLGENIVKKSMSVFDKEIEKNMTNIISENLGIIPQRINTLLTVSHRQKPVWALPKGYSVLIKAIVKDSDGSQYFYRSDDKPIKKHVSIDFLAITGIKKPFRVYWQVVNTGSEAIKSNCLRGSFESSNVGDITWNEATAYTGSHYIQCFIVKNGQCVAKSKEFIVNIE